MSVESYNLYKQGMVQNDKPLSLEDEIGLFNLIDHNQSLMRERAKARSDEDMFNTGHDFQDYETSNYASEADRYKALLEQNANKNWNRGQALRDIFNRHIDHNDELGFFEKRKMKSEFKKLYRGGSTKFGDPNEIEFNSPLTALGKDIQRKVGMHGTRTYIPENEKFGMNANTGADLLRLGGNIISNTAETAEFIYDAPKYLGSIVGLVPGEIGEFGDAWYEGYDLVAENTLGLLFEPIQALGEQEFMEYEGFFKHNPHLAHSLEFAGEVMLTLPVEFALVGKSIKNLGDAKYLQGIDKALKRQDYLYNNRIMRWYYNGRKKAHENILSHGGKMDKQYNIQGKTRWDVASHNTMKELKRDITYVNTALVGTEAMFQGLEYNTGGWFENDSIIAQGIKLPAMLFSGIFAPAMLHRNLQRAGIVEGGGRSIIKDLKFHAGYATGKHKGTIDDYLVEVMSLDKATVKKLGNDTEAKFALAKITREDYYSMRDMGNAIRTMEADFGKEYADEVLGFLATTLDRVDDVLKIRAFSDGYATGRGGKQVTKEDMAKWIEENPEAHENTRMFFDQLIGSQTVRALRNTLTENTKIPILQRLNAETLYQDAMRHSKIEAKQRDELAQTLSRYVEDARAMGDKNVADWLQHSLDYNAKAQNQIDDGIRKLMTKRDMAIDEMAQTRIGTEKLSRPNLRATLGDDITDETLNGINYSYDLMKRLGYTPSKDAMKNINKAKVELEDIPEEGISALRSKALKSRRKTWDDAYERIRAPLNANYTQARRDLEGAFINVDDANVNRAFDDLVKREFKITDEAAYSGLTPAAKQAKTFKAFHDRTLRRHINDLLESNSVDELIDLAKRDATNIGIGYDEIKITRTTKGVKKDISVDDATSAELAVYLKGRLKNKKQAFRPAGTEKEGVYLTLNLDELHSIKSNYRDIALMNMDNPTGFAAGNMATDLSNLIKVAGESLGDDTIMTFAKADEAWAENFVPLFKRGAGGEVTAVGKKYQMGSFSDRPHMVDDNAIFRTFIESENPDKSFEQFKKIFGADEKAMSYLKQDLGEMIELGKYDKIPPRTIEAMANHGIIKKDLQRDLSAWRRGLDIRSYESAAKNSSTYIKNTINTNMLNKIGPDATPVNKLINSISTSKGGTQDLYSILDAADLKTVNKMVKTADPAKRADLQKALADVSAMGIADDVVSASSKGEIMFRKENVAKSGKQVGSDKLQAETMTKRNALGWKSKSLDEEGSFRQSLRKLKQRIGGQDPDVITDPSAGAGTGSLRQYGIEEDIMYDTPLTRKGSKRKGDNYLEWSEAIESVALQDHLKKSTPGQLIKMYDPKRYNDLIAISDLTNVVDFTTLAQKGMAEGAVRSLSVESMISRMYSIVRGVVSARYVMTEAGFQAYRTQRRKILQQIIRDRETPTIILDMLAKDGLRDPQKKARWFRTLRGWFAALDEVSDEELEAAHNKK